MKEECDMIDIYYTYVLYSIKFDRLYIGLTNNLKRRLMEHNLGKSKSTKPYLPYKLIHVVESSTRVEARKIEKELKSSVGRRMLREDFV